MPNKRGGKGFLLNSHLNVSILQDIRPLERLGVCCCGALENKFMHQITECMEAVWYDTLTPRFSDL